MLNMFTITVLPIEWFLASSVGLLCTVDMFDDMIQVLKSGDTHQATQDCVVGSSPEFEDGVPCKLNIHELLIN